MIRLYLLSLRGRQFEISRDGRRNPVALQAIHVCHSLTVDTASGAPPDAPPSIPIGPLPMGTARLQLPDRYYDDPEAGPVVVGVRHRNRSRSSSVITSTHLPHPPRNYVSARCQPGMLQDATPRLLGPAQ